MRVRQIEETDVPLTRRLRLESLADAPDAFAATLEEELAMPDARWEERVRSNAEGIATAGFIAEDEDGGCGVVVGVWIGSEAPVVALNALWVAPRVRGRGVARALIAAVERWARTRGATRVELEVTQSSHAARALYASAGYELVAGPVLTCGRRSAPAFKMQKPIC